MHLVLAHETKSERTSGVFLLVLGMRRRHAEKTGSM
jgi:hypothetical protein